MLVRGDRRAVLAGVGFATLLNTPPLLMLAHRAGGVRMFVLELARSQDAWQAAVDPSTQVYGVDTPGLLSRLLGVRLPAGIYLAVSLAVLGGAAAALHSIRRWRAPGVAHLSASVICVGILLSVHHQAYDLVLLVAPVVAVAKASLPAGFLVQWRRSGLLILFAFLGANYITTLSVLHHLEHQRHAWVLLASLNGFLLLAVFLCYVGPLITSSDTLSAVSNER
jgi:hypothetical protein